MDGCMVEKEQNNINLTLITSLKQSLIYKMIHKIHYIAFRKIAGNYYRTYHLLSIECNGLITTTHRF